MTHFQKITQLLNHNFIRGGIILSLSTVIVNLFNYLFHVLSARTLGPSDYGEIASLFSYIALLSIPFSTIPSLIIRKLGYAGKDRKAVALAIETWFIGRVKQWWIIPIALLILTIFIPFLTGLQLISGFVLVCTVYLGIINSVYAALLNGLQFFKDVGIYSISTAFIKLIGVLLIIIGIGQIGTIYFWFIMQSLFGIGYCWYVLRKIPHQNKKDLFEIRSSVQSIVVHPATLLTSLSLLGITLLGNVDVIYVKRFFLTHDVGIYGAWSLFAKTIFYILSPLNAITLIFFSAHESKQNSRQAVNSILVLLTLTGIVFYILFSQYSTQITSLIMGDKFTDIASILPEASLFGIFFALANIMNNYFVAKKHKAQSLGFLSAPIYVFLLWYFGSTIDNIITINITYSFLLSLVYVVIYASQKRIATG